jgi:localization factor PodJL
MAAASPGEGGEEAPRAAAPAVAEPAPPALAVKPAEPVAGLEEPRDSGGLFSRLTSSQLLRRATGGRAESFSPHQEEAEEGADLPLEPGTDVPLNSALAGAPSSDTARMSGARGKGRAASAAGIEPGHPRRQTGEPAAGDDFLAAARRAARAAAAEVVEAEHGPQDSDQAPGLARLWSRVRGRRRLILASALVLAIAFTAVQIIRSRMDDKPETAALPAASMPAVPPESTAPAADDQAEGPALSAPSSSTPAPAQEAEATPPPAPASDLRSEEGSDLQAADAGAPPTSTATAALAPPASEAAIAAAETPAPTPAPQATIAPGAAPAPVSAALPPAIGPEKLRDAAMSGDAVAAFEVAARYAEGRGTAQDLAASVAWYTQAAEAGLAPAQYRLGSIYEKGMGVPKDLAAAQQWYRRAADAGNVKAMHNLAVLYAEGAGGQPDLERAAELFRKAAEHGVRDSQFNLAILHARGLGVPQDMIEAYKWFAVAATSGDAESLKRRDIIGAALSESDLAKAQAAAAAFQPLPLISEANDVPMPEGGWGDTATSLQQQSENELVALVQKLLAEKGFDPGPADGLLGHQTMQAITAFQEKAGLPATGLIDNGLVAALEEQST